MSRKNNKRCILRIQVAYCSSSDARDMGQVFLGLPREAKVGNFRSHIDVEEDVARFYISMDDTWTASRVQILEP